MNNFYVWAAMDGARNDYREGDRVPDGAGAYLYAGDTLEEARRLMVSDPATYETADGQPARLYIARETDGGEVPLIVSGPYSSSAWPMPYAPKRYYAGLSAYVATAAELETHNV